MTKPYLTYAQQIQKLRNDKGLVIDDEAYAEQKIRQLISYCFCAYYGEQQSYYLSAANYDQDPQKAAAVAKLINKLDYHANRNTEKQYLVHQRRVYRNVPLWVTTKILTFGELSKFYTLLQHRQQSAISKSYEYVSEKSLILIEALGDL